MLEKKDYSKMTLPELVSEEKKMKSQAIPTALIIGFLLGIAFWSATHKGSFLLTAALLIFAIFIGRKSSKAMKDIKDEINRRNSI